MQRKTLVLGAGNFGTALANHLAAKGEQVLLWARRAEIAASITKSQKNPSYLAEISLCPSLVAVSEVSPETMADVATVVIAIPTQHMESVLAPLAAMVRPHTIVVCASKGLELGSLRMPMTIVQDVWSCTSEESIAVLSGPSFAIEVAKGAPTAVSVASTSEKTARSVQALFHTGLFRAYTSHDPVGLEVAGALKNVIALASGAAKGMGLENNARAALLTRGLAEISRVALSLGASPITLNGLGGVGDLFITCTSEKSRNFRVGYGLGQGQELSSILAGLGSVAEGVSTARSAFELSQKLQVDAPIIKAVYQVVYEAKPLPAAVADLLGRDMKAEIT